MFKTLELINQMHPDRHPKLGMDIVIVVTSNRHQEEFWQRKLEQSKGKVIKTTALLLVVCEDWQSGAGNGLGTLYAYQQASLKAQALYQVTLDELLATGASAAMYHTAGRGMRLFPIAAAEHNNKAAVQLPDGKGTITLLEAVIRQTAIYAAGRSGRLSVFWGDQLFIPSEPPPVQSDAHVDILARLITFPDEEQWHAQNLSSYGLIANANQHDTRLLEKLSYAALKKLLVSGYLSENAFLGVSLGSFSISMIMLQALLEEFHDDLLKRKAKWDSDPHFWMPLTLSREVYLTNLNNVDESAVTALGQHYDRMQRFKNCHSHLINPTLPLLQVIDVGSAGYWWDYGSIDAYYRNLRKLTGQNAESHAMRSFFNLKVRLQSNQIPSVDIDNGSVICGTIVNTGKIRNSVVIGVTANTLDLQDCVVINSMAPLITTKDSLFYNVVESEPLTAPPQTVRADTFVGEGAQQFKMTTRFGRNGKSDWQHRIDDNPLSYAQLWQINQNTDFLEAQNLAAKTRQKMETILNPTEENLHDDNHLQKRAYRDSR